MNPGFPNRFVIIYRLLTIAVSPLTCFDQILSKSLKPCICEILKTVFWRFYAKIIGVTNIFNKSFLLTKRTCRYEFSQNMVYSLDTVLVV